MRTRHYRGFFDLFGRDTALSKACCMSPKVPELPQRQANRHYPKGDTGRRDALGDVSDLSSDKYGEHLSKEEVEAFVAPTSNRTAAVTAWMNENWPNATATSSASGPTSQLHRPTRSCPQSIHSSRTMAPALRPSAVPQLRDSINELRADVGWNLDEQYAVGPAIDIPAHFITVGGSFDDALLDAATTSLAWTSRRKSS
ncbi:uncharacterized protein C8Q71DRAFT_860278 [Rhodofomes roseus]|uniref:Peptidase S53 activation domain-containing protein n=1 Tax=Rhodofomes roseus TaxID=34475 RepID=A0ABQ8K945_9APHY|nr:uncharacterized protein C8Q71DRAFT_860278 [Rhodofomes roseus]KAH9833485.1 hypothetical protein C8Q71DRAFT_860278 [Rhodofomes roseus]